MTFVFAFLAVYRNLNNVTGVFTGAAPRSPFGVLSLSHSLNGNAFPLPDNRFYCSERCVSDELSSTEKGRDDMTDERGTMYE